MFWGLIPHWAKDEKRKFSTINAKAETAAELPTYRKPFRQQRCIVPATGFYEPDKVHHKKQPFPWHYFQLTDQSLFGFAGLYDIWTDKETGKDIWSYTIITTVPNEIVGQYHDRMPVILEQETRRRMARPGPCRRAADFADAEAVSVRKAWKNGASAMRRGIRRTMILKS